MGDQNTQSYNFQPLQVEQTTTSNSSTSSSTSFLKRFGPIILIVVGLILLVVLFLLLFRPTGNNNGTTPDPNRAVNLQWWGAFIDPEVIQPLIDQYKTVAPNVTIEYANKWPDLTYSEAEEKYTTELNRVLKSNDAVQMPDIFFINNRWIGDYEKYLSTAPSGTLSYTDFQNTYYPAVITDFSANNKIYGLPLWLDTLAIAYNKEMLASESVSTPPTDWSQFRSLAQRLTKRSGSTITQAGFAGGTSSNISFSFELANILMLQNGVPLVDPSGKPVFSSDDDSLTSMNFLKEFEKTGTGTWNTAQKTDAAAFLDEDLAMMATTSYRLRDVLKYNEGYQIGIDIGVSRLPQLAGQDELIINFADYWGNGVAIGRTNQTYAWAFLKWLNEPEQLRSLSTNIKNREGYFGILYPRKDMEAENNSDEYLKVFNESLPYIKSWYMTNGSKVETVYFENLGQSSLTSSNIAAYEKDIIDIIAAKGKLE